MSISYPAGKDGAVVLPVGNASDFMSFGLEETQGVESMAAYGAAVYEPYRGSGTPHQVVSVAGFAKQNAASTPPGFGSASGLASPGGGAATFTIGTGNTIAGNYVFSSLSIAHSRIRAAVPLTWQMHTSGDPTNTWPTT